MGLTKVFQIFDTRGLPPSSRIACPKSPAATEDRAQATAPHVLRLPFAQGMQRVGQQNRFVSGPATPRGPSPPNQDLASRKGFRFDMARRRFLHEQKMRLR